MSTYTSSVESRTATVAEIQAAAKASAVASVLGSTDLVLRQTDTYKYAFEVEGVDGRSHFVEVSFVCKKDDFDIEAAEAAFSAKMVARQEREAAREAKRAEAKRAAAAKSDKAVESTAVESTAGEVAGEAAGEVADPDGF